MHLLSLVSCLLAASTQAFVLPFTSTQASSSPSDNAPAVRRQGEVDAAASYWLEGMQRQGIAAFNKNPSGYKVFRNVKDYGARGDGVTDDSDAINRAISDGDRCGPWVCQSSTDSPAVVYFPSGTYLIGKPIIMYYMTQLHGNPNGRPVLKSTANPTGEMFIDSNPYSNQNGAPGWTSTNVFARQMRNFEIDLTAVPTNIKIRGIHWPASQATSLQNIKIRMTKSANSIHEGVFVENGSGGHMTDLEIDGGMYGLNVGNQQFTMKNIKVTNAVVGIYQIWNWGWLYKNLDISSCTTAFSMDNIDTGKNALQVGSAVIIDSKISDCPTFVKMSWTRNTKPIGAQQLVLENIALTNVPVAVKGPTDDTVLAGGSTTITAWGQGNKYTPDGAAGAQKFQGPITPVNRPAGLLDGNAYYAKSKPQYETLGVGSFISARTAGVRGDGTSDDTTALQNAINSAASQNKVLYLDQGVYKVTKTIYIPPAARIVGETYPVIMASGATWNNINNAVPVLKIGNTDESGHIELSDFLVATQGATPGAKLIEWNMKTDRGSGLWDVHTRIGGAKGTNLQVAQCPTMTNKPECYAAHTNVHITKSATGVYMENNWFWTADHDLDDWNSTRVSVYTGRGLLVEGSNVWLYGNGVEHHALYQYQFSGAKDVFAGYMQTETPYWQPSPDAANQPYPVNSALNDPVYSTFCPAGQICDSLGLRILNSQGVHMYGVGLYSFFKNYDLSCSGDNVAQGRRDCQNRIASIEGTSSGITAYSFNQVGALQMLTVDGQDKASWEDNLSVYSNTIGLFTYKA